MHFMEPFRGEAMLDLPTRHPGREQLHSRHDTTLPSGQGGNPGVHGASERFGTHTVPNPALEPRAPGRAP